MADVRDPLSAARIKERLIDLADQILAMRGEAIPMRRHSFMPRLTESHTIRSHRSPERRGDMFELDLAAAQ